MKCLYTSASSMHISSSSAANASVSMKSTSSMFFMGPIQYTCVHIPFHLKYFSLSAGLPACLQDVN